MGYCFITVDNFDLAFTAVTLAAVLVVLGLFHKEIFFASFDRTMAATLGKKVLFWDVLLYLLIGVTVSMAVLSVGAADFVWLPGYPDVDGASVRPDHEVVRHPRFAARRR